MKFFYIITILISLVGCSTVQPLTPEIVDLVGVHRLNEFQYYISKTTDFNTVGTDYSANIARGRLVQEVNKEDDYVRIHAIPKIFQNDVTYPAYRWIYKNRGMGLARRAEVASNDAAEPQRGRTSVRAGFSRTGVESDLYFWNLAGRDYFHLAFTDADERIISYNNRNYAVSFKGDEPYLMIKGKFKQNKKKQARAASGMRLGDRF